MPATPETPGDAPRVMLRDVARERFMSELYAGKLRPAQLISQRELCALLDVPMGPLREALKRLEGEDVVTLIPQRGIRILDIDEKTVNDAFQFRLLLEPQAVRFYAASGDPGPIRDLYGRTQVAADAGDRDPAASIEEINTLTTLDHEMHTHFVNAMRNSFADEVFARILGRLRLSRLVFRLRNLSDGRALREHLDILDQVLARNEDGAAEAMKYHLEASWRRALGLPN